MMSKAQKLLSGRAISVLLAFSTCLVLLASACGESDSGASGASAVATQAVDGSAYGGGTSPPMSVESPAVSSMSRSDADILDQVQEPLFYGAASPSLEKRIHESDVIVRASLSSTDSGELRFGVAEYLKGTGQSEIVVMAETATRNTTWDDREAILFLTPSEGQGASGAQGAGSRSWINPGVRFHRRSLQEPRRVHDRYARSRVAAG